MRKMLNCTATLRKSFFLSPWPVNFRLKEKEADFGRSEICDLGTLGSSPALCVVQQPGAGAQRSQVGRNPSPPCSAVFCGFSEVGQIAPSVVPERTMEGAAASRFDRLTVPDAGWTSRNQ